MRAEPRAPTTADDTAEVSTERALPAVAQQRMHDLVELVPAVLYEEQPGATGPTSFVSPHIGELLDVSPEDYIADPSWWIDHLHPDDRARMVEDADTYRRNPAIQSFTSEYRLVTQSGRTVWINDRSTCTRDAEGNPVLVRGAMFDVTPQKLAEAKVADAEVRYRTLVEQLPLITYIWEVDPAPGDDTAYYTSPQIESILGYTTADYDDDPEGWRELVHPEDRDRVNEAAARSETTGEPFVEEYRYLHKVDGHPVWVHDESVLIRRTEEGRPWLFQGVMYDITARVEADLALQSSLARFQTLAKHAPVGIFENAPDGSCTFVNDRWCEVAGMDPAPALGSGWTDAVHPEDRERVFDGWAAAVEADRDFLMEFRFVRPDGEVRWVTARAAAVKDAHGTTTGFVGTIDDTTERRATEEQLRLIRSAVEHTGHAVMVAALPADGGPAPVVYINPAFTTMTGLDATDVIGRAATTFYEARGDTTGMRDRILGGSNETLEVEMIRKDGSRVAAEGVLSPIRDAAGAFSNIVIILRDITEVREIERKLRESIEELRRGEADRRASLAQIVDAQEQELTRMAGGIEDHSLQQMSAVRMRMETLRRTLSDPAELGVLEKLEGSVEEAVGQLRGLVSELRPRELTTEGLGGAIREHLTRTAALRTEVVGALGQDPDQPQAATAFRVVQEAVASALLDRAARTLRVELEDQGDGFCVRIVDDGASWTTVGPRTMQDRAGLAGGRCRLFDGDGGATVELWLPLRAPVAGQHPLRRS
jgi:PAS domain S-box-containing protein